MDGPPPPYSRVTDAGAPKLPSYPGTFAATATAANQPQQQHVAQPAYTLPSYAATSQPMATTATAGYAGYAAPGVAHGHPQQATANYSVPPATAYAYANVAPTRGTPASSVSTPASTTSYPLADTVKLASSVKEHRQIEDLANFYSILKTLDVLESAYINDAVESQVYLAECNKLLGQHRMQESVLQGQGLIKDTEDFMMTYKHLHCPHALNRIKLGEPDDPNKAGGAAAAATQSQQSLHAFEAASHVITAKDEVAMDVTTVADIHPLLRDVVHALSRFDMPGAGKTKLNEWVARLNSREARDELDADDKTQLDFDLTLTYDELHKFLKTL